VNTAETTLTTATATFNAAKQPGTLILDRGALDAKITEAKTAKNSVIVAASAADAADGAKWATQAEVDALQAAITNAETLNAPNQGAVDSARSALTTALDTFNNAVNSHGLGNKTTGFSREDFSALLDRAYDAKDAVIESSNGNDVPPAREWVTTSVRNVLMDAIAVAKDVEDAGNPTDLDYLTLSNALNTFNDARRPGTIPDKTALFAAIESAKTARTGVVIATKREEVPTGSPWVTQDQRDALDTVYNAATGAATQNEVTQKTTELKNAIDTFNAAKAANGTGTAVNGLTITGLGTICNNGAEAGVGVVANMDVDFSSVTPVYANVTGGSLTVSLASLQNGSYYVGFSVDGFIVFISKAEVTFEGVPVSIAYNTTNFELLTWSVSGNDMGASGTTLNAFIGTMSGGQYSYNDTFKTFLKNMLWEMEMPPVKSIYKNLDFLDVAFYKNEACTSTQEFSGSELIGPNTPIYTKFSLTVLVGTGGGESGGGEPGGDKPGGDKLGEGGDKPGESGK
jgi:hypothetical protein